MAAPSNTMRSVSTWKSGAHFEHIAKSGVPYQTDARLEGFDQDTLAGAGPMEMLLGALAGCSGYDVVSLLKKMRVELKSFSIEIDAERRRENPRIFKSINVLYNIDAEPLDSRKILRAINFSVDKYCAVSAILSATAEMNWTLRCGGEEFTGTMHSK
ncbi:MAG: OsmC family protein [Candidatus Eisenbacteria bacterium]|uniref:OsmC family protein n=1 Tax=Eiseniibacteriota bacterium TaxID=2212470 RepID=A0A948RUQ8_UNCEI|nr:OsmC family protein [Candidatus Eisenbacteria bacterium]MBU1948294.1 OsmC family protein [Candidatus Eisenbacteria bacterium]MBU2690059.1 OsmC family protein [Candidatus Eisenbacteria bacterium]